MSDDLVKRLRDLGDHASFEPHMHHTAADRIEELEAKLAKAIEALRITDRWLRELDMYASPDYHLVPSLQMVRDTLAELTGGKDE